MVHHAPASILPEKDVGDGQGMRADPLLTEHQPHIAMNLGMGCRETHPRRLAQDIKPARKDFRPAMPRLMPRMNAGNVLSR